MKGRSWAPYSQSLSLVPSAHQPCAWPARGVSSSMPGSVYGSTPTSNCKAREAIQAVSRLLKPVYHRMIDPIRLADLLGTFIGLLIFEAASAVKEPQEKARFPASIRRKHRQIVVGDTGVLAENHLRGSCVPVQSLTTEYVSSGNVKVAVVIAVCRSPWKISLNQGSNYLIDIRPRTCANVGQRNAHRASNRIHDSGRFDVLLRTPLLPSILTEVEIFED
ncbi:hypothetical protein KC336_g31 [Hortaea werneckii]|nr:hypothetical protein KC336_g31 [Hortaea werneckii]